MEERQAANVFGVITFRTCDTVQIPRYHTSHFLLEPWSLSFRKIERLYVCVHAHTHTHTHDRIMKNTCIRDIIYITNFYYFPGLTQNPDDSIRSKLGSLI